MGVVLRRLALLLALAALGLPAAAFDGPTQQSKKAAPAKAPKEAPADSEDAGKGAALVQQAFEGGIKAYNAGKFEEAQRAFEAAIRGGLPNQQMPRALYYRGLTFRKLGKPGFAISDLTAALWLKGGLSEAERADAIKTRALAYNESGISDVPPAPQSAYAEAPKLPGPAPEAPTAMAASSAAPTPAAAPSAPAAAEPQSSSSGGIGGFFSSLFGGGSSDSAPAQETPATTASLANGSPASAGDGGGWSGTTEVVAHSSPASAPRRGPEGGAPFVTQVASVAEPEASAAPSVQAPPSGKFRLQVAAVRSRSEADALADLLVGRHGEQLGGRQPQVDESVIGSMGTFYRVRLGPYASAKEPEQLCVALRADGFDCLVVAQ
jgi:tetratricopeptide (TPR) repeat protein